MIKELQSKQRRGTNKKKDKSDKLFDGRCMDIVVDLPLAGECVAIVRLTRNGWKKQGSLWLGVDILWLLLLALLKD